MSKAPRPYTLALALLLIIPFAPATYAGNETIPHLSAPVEHAFPDLHLLGHGVLRFLFWKIYDIALYVPGTVWKPDVPYALSVTYARSFTGKEIADEGIKQMRHMGYRDAAQLERWHADMLHAFPGVQRGDHLTALYVPPDNTRVYLNGKLTNTIQNGAFAQAFFGMWLSPQSSQPALRRALLHLPD